MHNYSISCIHFDDDTSIYHDIRYIDTTEMCIDTVSLLNVSRYGDISIYRCISNISSLLPSNAMVKIIAVGYCLNKTWTIAYKSIQKYTFRYGT